MLLRLSRLVMLWMMFAQKSSCFLPRIHPHLPLPSNAIRMLTGREADFTEQIIGGVRYEFAELPDSMIPTTVFVGSLNEFVTDDDLSRLFQSVSKLHSVPACVARKADMSSLSYGFVCFPTREEKETAIIRFHNSEFMGTQIRVEEIQDSGKFGRVRVPEKLIAYCSGAVTKDKNGSKNGLRRISRDDVERLSRGQPAKKKGYGSRNVPHRLNDEERAEIERASKRGYVSLSGTGNRRTRKGSPLVNIHRQWCDARAKPQIMLVKAIGGRPLDHVIVDLSPLRVNGLFDDPKQVESFLVRWKTEILSAAERAGLEISNEASTEFDPDDDEESTVVSIEQGDTDAWANNPIWQLPPVTLAFVGERSNAKNMAKELATLWDIPEIAIDPSSGGAISRRTAGAKKGGRTKMKGISQHRKRGGGHRQSIY